METTAAAYPPSTKTEVDESGKRDSSARAHIRFLPRYPAGGSQPIG